jgi:hypothetical protein
LEDQHVANREIPVEVVLLRGKSDRASRFAPIDLIVVAEDADRTGIGACKADDRIDRRRLAGAVRPEKAEKFAGRNAQRDAVNGREAAVAFDEIVDFDGRCYGTYPLSRL